VREKSPAAGVERVNVNVVERDLWAQIQDQAAQTNAAEPNLWIPSGLGLDLGLDGVPASDDLYYLPTDGYNPMEAQDATQSSSLGMRQTLFDIGSNAGPLSAISASEYSIPFEFSSLTQDPTRDGDENAVELLSDEMTLGSGTAEWDALGGTMMDVQ
jgi:hypothetical protein